MTRHIWKFALLSTLATACGNSTSQPLCSEATCSDARTVDAAAMADACGSVRFQASPVTPSIQLVIDRSSSMNFAFGETGPSRWTALKAALTGDAGVVTRLEPRAFFGVTIYPAPGETCAPFDQTASRTQNAASGIRELLRARGPSGETPTGAAIAQATASFMGAGAPPPNSPAFIVLATDGTPNSCPGAANEYAGRDGTLRAVREAYAAGVHVLPLALGLNGTALAHLQDVANAGSGVAAGGPDATVYRGDSPEQLQQAFEAIIGAVISCTFTIDGRVDPTNAQQNGTVTLNGRPLRSGSDWRVVDATTLELLGTACDELKAQANPEVVATFTCEAIVE